MSHDLTRSMEDCHGDSATLYAMTGDELAEMDAHFGYGDFELTDAELCELASMEDRRNPAVNIAAANIKIMDSIASLFAKSA